MSSKVSRCRSKRWMLVTLTCEQRSQCEPTRVRLNRRLLSYLMHWPVAMIDGSSLLSTLIYSELIAFYPGRTLGPKESPTIVDTWKDMEKLLGTGKVKAIGVSNFSIERLQQLLDECTVVPAVNQVECHPSLPQFELVKFCQAHGIHVTAYSSLGQPGGRPADGGVCNLLDNSQRGALLTAELSD